MPKFGTLVRHDAPRPAEVPASPHDSDLPIVLIKDDVLETMWRHAESGIPNEVFGYLIGYPIIDPRSGLGATYIQEALATESTGTPTYVTARPEVYHAVLARCEETGTVVVGYYHSHPGLSVFQSGTDLRHYDRYYSDPYKVAIVVDPTRSSPENLTIDGDWIGFFGWNGDRVSTRVPASNLHLVTSPPTALESREQGAGPTEEKEGAQLKATGERLARAMEVVATTVAQDAVALRVGLPLVVLTSGAEVAMRSPDDPNAPSEGLLLGITGSIGQQDFVLVTARAPVAFEALKPYSDALTHEGTHGDQGPAAPLGTLDAVRQGATVVGLYGPGARLKGVLTPDRWFGLFHRPSDTLTGIARASGKYCVMASRDTGEQLSLSLSVFRLADARQLTLPESHVLRIQEEADGTL